MIRPAQLLRLMHINLVLVRHGLDEVILATHLFRPVRFVLYLLPWHWFRNRNIPHGVRVRRALEDLGPIFIKFGQMLSTRRDLLPDDLANELARLQDRVPPFPGHQARTMVEELYELPLREVFHRFEDEPLASASIAQVHGAELQDGRKVVVKVLRPGVHRAIRRDVAVLRIMAEWAERYWPESRRLRPRGVVAEYEKTLLDELDLQREAANASQLRRNFSASSLLYVPEVFWPLTRQDVLVIERINGIPISDVEGLERTGVDLKLLAEKGVEIFFTQVFRHNFFHADMHPGNIFVDAETTRYMAVDFGIMGSLSPVDQRYLAENFVAFFRRDYRRVAELHVQSGWVPSETRVDEFEAAIRTVCEPIFERPLKDISFGYVLLRLFQTARRFNMEVQPQLVLLQKTLLNIEGLGRQLYPELDLWQTAKPFLERWMSEQIGIRALTRGVKEQAPRWAEQLPEVPGLLYDVAHRAREGNLEVRFKDDELTRTLNQTIRRASRSTFAAIIGGALVISAIVLVGEAEGVDEPLGLAALALGILGVLAWLVAWPRRG